MTKTEKQGRRITARLVRQASQAPLTQGIYLTCLRVRLGIFNTLNAVNRARVHTDTELLITAGIQQILRKKTCMCLGIPAQIVSIHTPLNEATALLRQGIVSIGPIEQQVYLGCVPQACVGDYVLLHAGIAIATLNEQEASNMLSTLDELSTKTIGSAFEAEVET